MPGIYRSTWVALVGLISADVVSSLAAAGLPPLSLGIDGSPGQIQIGPQFVAEQGSPPRILMIPRGWDEEQTRDVTAARKNGVEYGNSQTPRAIAMQWKRFEVQCWGMNFTDQNTAAPDPALDYDAAQILAELVWQSAQRLAAGVWRSAKGDIDPGAPYLVREGRLFIFDLAMLTPIPDVTLGYAPSNVKPSTSVEIIVNGQPPVGPGG